MYSGFKTQSMIFVLLLLAVFSFACSSDAETIADGDFDALENELEADAIDGDIIDGADSDVDTADTDDIEIVHFEYSGCIKTSQQYQFPTPYWETAGDSLTGVLLSPPANDMVADLLEDERATWHEQVGSLDGFALLGAYFIALDGAGTSVDTSKIAIYSWLDGNITKLDEVNFKTEFSEDNQVLMLETHMPLKAPEQGERYILAIYDGAISDANPYPACDGENAHEQYVSAADALVLSGMGENLLYANAFTPTRTAQAHANLYDELLKNPVLTVKEFTALDSFDSSVDSSCLNMDTHYCDALKNEFSDGGLDSTISSLAAQSYKGVLTLPSYLNADKIIELDPNSGLPIATGETEPGFFIVLPKTGTAPYPVIVFQHGGSRYKYDLLNIAKPYAKLGFAIIGIDLPYHGDRAADGVTGSLTDMVDPISLLKSRDVFRQASSDHLALITGLSAINAELETFTSKSETLSEDEVFYIGHSMGSISGTLTVGVCDQINGALLLAGGGSYRQLMQEGFFSAMILDIMALPSKIKKSVLLNMMQLLLDGGDPINFPQNLENHDLDPKDVVLLEIIRDPLVNNTSTDLQATAFGAGLLPPVNHDVEAMDNLTLPASGNFQWATGNSSKASRVLLQLDVPEMATGDLHMEAFMNIAAHNKVAPCFSGRVAGTGCVIE